MKSVVLSEEDLALIRAWQNDLEGAQRMLKVAGNRIEALCNEMELCETDYGCSFVRAHQAKIMNLIEEIELTLYFVLEPESNDLFGDGV